MTQYNPYRHYRPDAIPTILRSKLDNAISNAVSNATIKAGQDCLSKDKTFFTRNRKLPMQTMVKLLISMQGGSLKKELYDAGADVTASAFVQQRNKVSHEVWEDVLEEFNKSCSEMDTKTYKGYRVLAVDGTTVNMARNPKSDSFVVNESNPKGYNQLHVNPIYDVLNKVYLHCVIQPQPKQDEVGALGFMLTWYDDYPQKTLIVADRGYESYNVFAHFLADGKSDFLIRVKQDRSAMREIRKLPMMECDTEISFSITTTQTKEDKTQGRIFIQTHKDKNRIYSNKTRAGRWDFPSPYDMKFRIVRFMLDTGEYETLATSLPRSITLDEIKELYHSRWGIETAFRELKYGIGLVNLHGKKDDFVKQEIFASMIISNFCSRIVNQIVIEQKKTTVHEYKVNMQMAVYLCRRFYQTKGADGKKLMEEIAKYLEPVRPDRRDTRNLKAKSFVGFIYRIPA